MGWPLSSARRKRRKATLDPDAARRFVAQNHARPSRLGRGPKKAILAVAASMLTAVYHMLKHSADYRDLGADHFDRRDKAKLAKRLIARLHDLGLTVEVRAA